MKDSVVQYSVFTKPWRQPLPELGRIMADIGFQGIELPVRPGFQVEPDKMAKDLPAATKLLADFGLKIFSIAGPTDEPTIAACAEAGVPVIRICIDLVKDLGYLDTEKYWWRRFDELVPLLDKYGVTIGVQNHCDRCVANAIGVRHLIEKYDPRHVAAVWDPAHCGLNGELPELAIDILWSNLKNAYWDLIGGPEAPIARWSHYWTDGRHGFAAWPDVVDELKKRDWSGVCCLTAEYSDEARVEQLITQDLVWAKQLFAGEGE
jgi:sugar phosphate isomerase/epimerase